MFGWETMRWLPSSCLTLSPAAPRSLRGVRPRLSFLFPCFTRASYIHGHIDKSHNFKKYLHKFMNCTVSSFTRSINVFAHCALHYRPILSVYPCLNYCSKEVQVIHFCPLYSFTQSPGLYCTHVYSPVEERPPPLIWPK